MKARHIINTIIILYLALLAVTIVFAVNQKSESEENTPTPTAAVSNCEKDKSDIQAALDAYHEANGEWPTADGLPGDIIWDKLVPEYMSEMPLIDDQCNWQVSSNPVGQVCVSHTC